MSILRTVFLCLCLISGFITSSAAFSQGRVRFDHITADDGLADSNIGDIFQDVDGYLWFATRSGLSRYNGYDFSSLDHHPEDSTTLAGNWVSQLEEAPSGDLWIYLGIGGVERLSRKTGALTYFRKEGEEGHGLSSDIVNVVSTHNGKTWIGTGSGLNRVDVEKGSSQVFDQHGLSQAFIVDILSTKSNLWIGTNRGAFTIDSETEQARPVHLDGARPSIAFFHETPDGSILIATNRGRFYRGKQGEDEFRFVCDANEQLDTSLFLTSKRTMDHEEALWCLPFAGRPFRFLIEEKRCEDTLARVEKGVSIAQTTISDMLHDRRGNLWMATASSGIYRFRSSQKEIDHFLHRPTDPTSLLGNRVSALFEDRTGLIWIGCQGRGVSYMDPRKQQFLIAGADPADPNGLPPSGITAVAFGPSDELWLGTRSRGLFCLDPTATRILHRFTESRSRLGLTSRAVTSLVVDRSQLWVGTSNGLNRADLAKFVVGRDEALRFHRYYSNPVDSTTLTSNNITCLGKSVTGSIWVGHASPGGISLVDPETGLVRRFLPDFTRPDGLSQASVWALLEQDEETLWIGSPGLGLNKLHVPTATVTHFPRKPNDPTSMNNRTVNSLLLDREERLWVGTFSGGLNLLDQESITFSHVTQRSGLPTNMINGMVQGSDGRLWLATNRGLCAYDPRTGQMAPYTTQDGLQGLEFTIGAIAQSKSGKILVGGENGVNVFDPRLLEKNVIPPQVKITSLQQGSRELLRWGMHLTELKLNHQENDLNFEFAALDFANPSQNQYRYRLEGLSSEWVDAGERRIASYANLPPGEYLFRVQGSNSDGVWNLEGATLPISILPPFWQWNTFRLGASLSVLLSIIILFRWRVRGIQKQKRLLEEKVAENTAELRQKNQELNRLNQDKSEFVRIAAHDMRTPLTSLNAYLTLTAESLQDGTFDTETVVQDLSDAQACTTRVSRLLSSMLDIAAIEDGRLGLDLVPASLVELVQERSRFFRRVAQQKKLDLSSERSDCSTLVSMDRERMGEVLDNLMSNAIKFTYPGGRIRIATRSQSGVVQVSVHDTGQGLDDEDLQRVFGRFQRLSARPTGGEASTGLGLAIVKKIVELHGGEVSVTSQKGEGSTFSFSLPALADPKPLPPPVLT